MPSWWKRLRSFYPTREYRSQRSGCELLRRFVYTALIQR